MYAAAILFSQTAHTEWIGQYWHGPYDGALAAQTGLAASAFAVLLLPSAARRLLVLAVLYVVCIAMRLPEVPNHQIVLCLMGLSICGAGCLERHDADALHRVYRDAIRAIVVVVYAFAFFAKVNADYLDPEASCASQFLAHMALGRDGLGGSATMRGISIWGSLVLEAWFPFGLLWRRTRFATVMVAGAFHVVLTLDLVKHFVDFSSVMLVGLSTFVPGASAARMTAAWRTRYERHCAPWPVLRTFGQPTSWFIVGLLLLVLTVPLVVWDRTFLPFLLVVRELVWLPYALGVGLAWWWVRDGDPERAGAPSRAARALSVAMVVLATTNGLGPYLGLKTRTSYNMYANLMIDDERSNHLVVPRSLDVFGFLADRAVIEATEDAELLRRVGAVGVEIPYVGLASYLVEHPETSVRYRYGAVVYAHPTDPLPAQPPWIVRKLALFRPIGSAVADFCIW
jgi:hypothetical protein